MTQEGKITYRCEAGLEIEALRLAVPSSWGLLGILRRPGRRYAPGREPSLLGILVEQFPDRQAPGRASDVLFAATIAEALRRFNCLALGHLVNVLYADEQTPWKCSSSRRASATGHGLVGTSRSVGIPKSGPTPHRDHQGVGKGRSAGSGGGLRAGFAGPIAPRGQQLA